MSSIICRIGTAPATTNAYTVMISQPLLNRWGCHRGQTIKVSIGNKSLRARIQPIKSRLHLISLAPGMNSRLSIPYLGDVRVSYRMDELRIGPVIAILTTGYSSSSSATPFGIRTNHFFKNFLMEGYPARPYFYVFTPEMVDWKNRVVAGWFYTRDSNGEWTWKRRISPLPDVIYERVPNRRSESNPKVQACVARLKTIGHSHVFNQGFFSKWAVHEKLLTHDHVSENIPETYPHPDIGIIRGMVDRHQMVYLKPNGGSLGLGIYRITRHPQRGFYCRYRDGKKNVLCRFYSLETLLKRYFGPNLTSLRRYLVQQGVRLIKFDGRPVDFRVHMHKDRTGGWKVVAIGGKVAGIGSVTTHERTGGSIITTSALFSRVFPDQEREMERKIIETSIRIAHVIEKELPGPLGELGLDIGVDGFQRVWLFEANSKPGRHIFLHPAFRNAGRHSARCITEYSLKLAQFV